MSMLRCREAAGFDAAVSATKAAGVRCCPHSAPVATSAAGDADLVVLDLVDQAVLVSNAARPKPVESVLQGFRLADALVVVAGPPLGNAGPFTFVGADTLTKRPGRRSCIEPARVGQFDSLHYSLWVMSLEGPQGSPSSFEKGPGFGCLTRRLLIDTARSLGLSAPPRLRLNDIASLAGVASEACQDLFGDLAGIASAVFDEDAESAARLMLSRQVDDLLSFEAAARTVVHFLVDNVVDNFGLYAAAVESQVGRSPYISRFSSPQSEVLIRLWLRGQAPWTDEVIADRLTIASSSWSMFTSSPQPSRRRAVRVGCWCRGSCADRRR